MDKGKRAYPPSVPIDKYFNERMKDPEFRRAYDELEPEFAIIKQIIDLRLKRKMTQTELARRAGTPQPSIARLESRGQVKNLDYLRRIAKALNARVEVRLVPSKASGKHGQGRRALKRA